MPPFSGNISERVATIIAENTNSAKITFKKSPLRHAITEKITEPITGTINPPMFILNEPMVILGISAPTISKSETTKPNHGAIGTLLKKESASRKRQV